MNRRINGITVLIDHPYVMLKEGHPCMISFPTYRSLKNSLDSLDMFYALYRIQDDCFDKAIEELKAGCMRTGASDRIMAILEREIDFITTCKAVERVKQINGRIKRN